jgi:hypothetical protein
MQSLPIADVSEYLIVAHYTCPDELHGNQGAYEIMLDDTQYDELAKNGYTLTTETCLLCQEPATFVLRLQEAP